MVTIAMGRDSGMINKRLLADAVFDRLLADIIGGRFAVEERLHVDEIAAELGVSRTPVREAIVRLNTGRFVEVTRNSRTQVAMWDASDMRDRLEVMSRLVCLVAGDPRLNIGELAAGSSAPVLEDDACADAQMFLDFAELLVVGGANRVADYVLRELIRPLRLYLREPVLAGYGIDLCARQDDRCLHLLGAFSAAARGDRGQLQNVLLAYTSELAGAIAPRNGDRATPDTVPASSSEAAA